MLLERNKMKVLIIMLGLFAPILCEYADKWSDLNNIPVCATLNNVNKTFANIWQLYHEFKTTGKLWIPLATGACPISNIACTFFTPVCAVSINNFYKTFPNKCVLEAEQKATGIAWNIVYNGTCSSNPGDGFMTSGTAIATEQYRSGQESQPLSSNNYSKNSTTMQDQSSVPQSYSSSSYHTAPSPVSGQYNLVQEPQSFANYNSDSVQSPVVSPPPQSDSLSCNEASPSASGKYNLAQELQSSNNYQQVSATRPAVSTPEPSSYNNAPSPASGQYNPVKEPQSSTNYRPASAVGTAVLPPLQSDASSSYNEEAPKPPSCNGAHSPALKQYNLIKEPHSSGDYRPASIQVSTAAASSHSSFNEATLSISGNYNSTQEMQSSDNCNQAAPKPAESAQLLPTYNEASSLVSEQYNMVQEQQASDYYKSASIQSPAALAPSHLYASSASSSTSVQYNPIQEPQYSGNYNQVSAPSPAVLASLPPAYNKIPATVAEQYNSTQEAVSSGYYNPNSGVLAPSKSNSLLSCKKAPSPTSEQDKPEHKSSCSCKKVLVPSQALSTSSPPAYNNLPSSASAQYNAIKEPHSTGDDNKPASVQILTASAPLQSYSSSSHNDAISHISENYNSAQELQSFGSCNQVLASKPAIAPSSPELYIDASFPTQYNTAQEPPLSASVQSIRLPVPSNSLVTSLQVVSGASQSYFSPPSQSSSLAHVSNSSHMPNNSKYTQSDSEQIPSEEPVALYGQHQIKQSKISNLAPFKHSYGSSVTNSQTSSALGSPESISDLGSNPSNGYSNNAKQSVPSVATYSDSKNQNLPSYSQISYDVPPLTTTDKSNTFCNRTKNSDLSNQNDQSEPDSNADVSKQNNESQTIYNGAVYQGPYYYEPKYRHINFGNFNFLPAQNLAPQAVTPVAPVIVSDKYYEAKPDAPYPGYSASAYEQLLKHLQYIAAIKYNRPI